MSQQPRYWKQVERHPLSAEYPDIKGKEWTAYVDNLREFGIVGGRKIVLHEGKVIDGWQLLRACVEANVRPTFVDLKLPKGMTVEQWVETVNDYRRQETMDVMRVRADSRRMRVLAARQAGQSLRSIAEQEEVSEKTIRKDIDVITADGTQCAPPDGKVTGKDNRKHPATKPEPEPEPEPEIPAAPVPDRLRQRALARTTLPQTSALHVKASSIADAVHGVGEALREGCEGSDGVLRRTFEAQGKKLEKVTSDIDGLLHPSENGAPTKEQRNALFDAVAEVTGSDPKVSGGHIARVVKLLLSANPPYEPGDIFALPAAIKKRKLDFTLTVGSIEKYIGWVRNQPVASRDDMFDSLKRFVERGN